MAILKDTTTRKMLKAFMAARPAADVVVQHLNAGLEVGETIRRLDAGMKSSGKRSFTIADIRRIRNEIYTGNESE